MLVNKLVYANQITWLFKRRGFYINIFEVIRLTGKKKHQVIPNLFSQLNANLSKLISITSEAPTA